MTNPNPMSFKEIGARIGVSEGHAHRMHEDLIEELKERLVQDPYVKEYLKSMVCLPQDNSDETA